MGNLFIVNSGYNALAQRSALLVRLKADDVVPKDGRSAWLSKHGVYTTHDIMVDAPGAAWEAAGVPLAGDGALALVAGCSPATLEGTTGDVRRVSEAIYGALVEREREQHAESRVPPPFDASALLKACSVEREAALRAERERERLSDALLAELDSIVSKEPELCSAADIARADELFNNPRRSLCSERGHARSLREWLSRAEKLPLRAYVRAHGRVDQAERFEAGFLPHAEVLDILRERELPLIEGMMLFPKLDANSIVHDLDSHHDEPHEEECSYDMLGGAHVSMGVGDFAIFKRVAEAYRNVSGVEVVVCKHTARCKVCLQERYRYGVRARVVRFDVAVAREYLLPDLSEMTIPQPAEPKEERA